MGKAVSRAPARQCLFRLAIPAFLLIVIAGASRASEAPEPSPPEILTDVFDISPVLGCAGETFFSIAFETESDALVSLNVDGRTMVSQDDENHRFWVRDLSPGRSYEWHLTIREREDAERVITTPPQVLTTFRRGDPLSFVVYGDNRSNPAVWGRVAAAMLEQNPALALGLGDFVDEGLLKMRWKEQFFRPAAPFLSRVPQYFVMGNHDRNSSVPLWFMRTPSGTSNWSQRLGPVLLVGLNDSHDWDADDELALWLDATLEKSDAPYVFAALHVPPYSSGKYGRADPETGAPLDGGVQVVRNQILPILQKHKVTALFAGHAHCYERSELPGGLTLVVAAGGGAPLYGALETAKAQNPYSACFRAAYHFVRIDVEEAGCRLQAIGLDGAVFDTREWEPRNVSAAEE